jgi:Zn-dependent protease
LKIMFLLNFFNLLPFSSDGESAIYSIMKGKKK